MLIAEPLAHSADALPNQGAAWPPSIQLTKGRNDRIVRATAQARASATRSVAVTERSLAQLPPSSAWTRRSRKGGGFFQDASTSFQLDKEILQVALAHAGDSGGLRERRRPSRGQLLPRLRRQRMKGLVRQVDGERELRHAL